MIKVKNKKGQKNCVIKRKIKFQDYKNCLKASQMVNIVNQEFDNIKNTTKI